MAAKTLLSTAISRPFAEDVQAALRESAQHCMTANAPSLYKPIGEELVWQWSRGEDGAREIRAILNQQLTDMKDSPYGTSAAWHTWIEGVKSSIKPYGLVLKTSRNWRSGKGIFEIVEASTIQAAKEEEEKRQANIDALDASARALTARQAKLDLSVDEIVEQVWRIIDETSASRSMIIEALAKSEGFTLAKPKAAKPKAAKPQAAKPQAA